jgi:hypothetical protein
MRPYVPGEDLSGVSVSSEFTPRKGDMIARDPSNHADVWHVDGDFFQENYVPAE